MNKQWYIFPCLFLMFNIAYSQVPTEKIERESALTARIDCQTLGFRWGYTARAAMFGIKAKPGWDFSIPKRCRAKTETEKGIKSGVYAASK